MTAADDAPIVVLLHGVGVGAESFQPVARALVPGHGVALPDRSGYGTGAGAPRTRIEDHVEDFGRFLTSLPRPPAVVAGVSGGATIALAAALAGALAGRDGSPPGLLLHEPLLGELVPELHAAASAAADALQRGEPGGENAFLRRLAGEPLPPVGPEVGAVVRAEVPSFLAFQPDIRDLERLGELPLLVTTIGDRSGRPRQAAAELLAQAGGAHVVTIPGCGHLPQLQAPERLAAAIAATGRGAAARRASVCLS
ncbi:MAG TPA: alpha/beta hydrolase [Egibacteraceae bacterium]|nr:alpha/beta hydrolase [Egibacteraceae bacterium]